MCGRGRGKDHGQKRNKRNWLKQEDGFEGWGGYMAAKRAKLLDQFHSGPIQKETDILAGVKIMINGLTHPPADELKELMAKHGGEWHMYQTSATTHIIASNLPNTKIKHLGAVPIVKPAWIVESIGLGKLLDYKRYLLYTNQSSKQPALNFPVINKSDNQSTSLGDNHVKNDCTNKQYRNIKENYDLNIPVINKNVSQSSSSTVEKTDSEINQDSYINLIHPEYITNLKKTEEIPNANENGVFNKLENRNIDKSENETLQNTNNSFNSNKNLNSNAGLVNKNGKASNENEDGYYSDADLFNDEDFNFIKTNFNKETKKQETNTKLPGTFSNTNMTDMPTESIKTNTVSNPGSLKTSKTASDPHFLEEFYNNSRLHLISTLGAEFKQLVGKLRDKSDGKFPGRQKIKKEIGSTPASLAQSVVMHIDMDCFFVSVGLRNHPELKGKPVAITHARSGTIASSDPVKEAEKQANRIKEFEMYAERLPEGAPSRVVDIKEKIDGLASMSEIASCSYEARKCGIKNGMFMGQAIKLCPDLKTLPYDFEGYKEVSNTLYKTVASYTLDIEAVSCDEMYVDVKPILIETGLTVEEWANHIRKEIMEVTGCPCSTGFGTNRLQARLATRKAKPAGQYYLQPDDVEDYMSSIPLEDLPGVGRATLGKLKSLGLRTCGDVQGASLKLLQSELGNKLGEKIKDQSFGRDNIPLNFQHERKSVSAEINYGIRFKSKDECYNFLQSLSTEVYNRLSDINMKSRCLTLKLLVRAEGAPVFWEGTAPLPSLYQPPLQSTFKNHRMRESQSAAYSKKGALRMKGSEPQLLCVRMNKNGLYLCYKETAKFLGHGVCDALSKSTTSNQILADSSAIYREAKALYDKLNVPFAELRGVGIQLTKLEKTAPINKALSNFLQKGCTKNPFEIENACQSDKTSITKKSPKKSNEISIEKNIKNTGQCITNVSKTQERTTPDFVINPNGQNGTTNIAKVKGRITPVPQMKLTDFITQGKSNKSPKIHPMETTPTKTDINSLVKSPFKVGQNSNMVSPLKNTQSSIKSSLITSTTQKRKRGRPRGSKSSDKTIRNSRSAAKSNNKNVNMMHSFLGIKHKEQNVFQPSQQQQYMNDIDMEVFNELPPDIREEVMRDYNFKSMAQPMRDTQIQSKSVKPVRSQTLDGNLKSQKTVKKRQEKTNPSSSVNNLETSPFTNLAWENIKPIIKAWIKSEKEPDGADIEMLGKHFRQLAIDRKIEVLQSIFNFLHRIFADLSCGWHQAYFTFVNMMQTGMVQQYGSVLLVDTKFHCCRIS